MPCRIGEPARASLLFASAAAMPWPSVSNGRADMTSISTTLRQTKPSAVVWVIGFAVALAAAAQVTMPIPGTPVPFTLQPLVVVLAGLMLGPVAGASSMILYLIVGAT